MQITRTRGIYTQKFTLAGTSSNGGSYCLDLYPVKVQARDCQS
jgi:hypothetical protein